jgi:3-hydroxyisobutyrate dehydrogenase
MPITVTAREALQAHIGAAHLQPDPTGYLAKDFATLLESVARTAGMTLQPENVPTPTGLETEG